MSNETQSTESDTRQPIEKGLKQQVTEINEKLNVFMEHTNAKEKKFKLKWNVRRQLKTLAKKNKILVFLLTRNRAIKTLIEKVTNGYIMVNGSPREIALDYVFLYEGKIPAVVLPDWDMQPIGTAEYYEAIESGDRNADSSATLIRMLESQEFEDKKKGGISPFIWVIIGLVAVVVIGYLIFGGNIA